MSRAGLRGRTWTERVAAIDPRAVLTERARAEACRRVGKDAHAVAAVGRDLGVGWATVMRAVGDHGRPLVDDPTRLEGVAALGLDETSFLKATRVAPTRYVTGLVDLERGRLLDLVADRTTAAVEGWLAARSPDWLAQVGRVALDPWRGYANALVAPLGHATVVVDHFHAIRLANAVVDQVRRRVQQATLGHRGRKCDPLYRIRKLLSPRKSSSPSGDGCGYGPALPLEIPPARSPRPGKAKSCCGPSTPRPARRQPGSRWTAFYLWADGVRVTGLARLARTVRAWEAEILAFHTTGGCSNGPTEAVNLSSRRSSGLGTASATSPTTGCGCCCTVTSAGRCTEPDGCGAAVDPWWRSGACRAIPPGPLA
jgi:transposase